MFDWEKGTIVEIKESRLCRSGVGVTVQRDDDSDSPLSGICTLIDSDNFDFEPKEGQRVRYHIYKRWWVKDKESPADDWTDEGRVLGVEEGFPNDKDVIIKTLESQYLRRCGGEALENMVLGDKRDDVIPIERFDGRPEEGDIVRSKVTTDVELMEESDES